MRWLHLTKWYDRATEITAHLDVTLYFRIVSILLLRVAVLRLNFTDEIFGVVTMSI